MVSSRQTYSIDKFLSRSARIQRARVTQAEAAISTGKVEDLVAGSSQETAIMEIRAVASLAGRITRIEATPVAASSETEGPAATAEAASFLITTTVVGALTMQGAEGSSRTTPIQITIVEEEVSSPEIVRTVEAPSSTMETIIREVVEDSSAITTVGVVSSTIITVTTTGVAVSSTTTITTIATASSTATITAAVADMATSTIAITRTRGLAS